MAKKEFWQGMLALVLAFGMMVVGCPEEEEIVLPTGPKWTMVANPPFGIGRIKDIAYGDGKFIAVGFSSSNSRIAYSTDGVNWVLINNLSAYIYPDAIAYGGGKWVTDDSYSTDGLNWIAGTSTLRINSPKIVYGNGKFLAIGEQNKIAYSTDGQSWVDVSNPPFITDSNPDYINDIAYGDGKFIVVGGNKIANSTDGTNWRSVSPTLFGDMIIDHIAYGNGKFVASNWNAMAYSMDGINWRSVNGKEKGNGWGFDYNKFDCIAYGNGKWIALRSTWGLGYSSDGINWTPAFNPPNLSFPRKIIYGDGKFVVLGGGSDGGIAYSIQ